MVYSADARNDRLIPVSAVLAVVEVVGPGHAGVFNGHVKTRPSFPIDFDMTEV